MMQPCMRTCRCDCRIFQGHDTLGSFRSTSFSLCPHWNRSKGFLEETWPNSGWNFKEHTRSSPRTLYETKPHTRAANCWSCNRWPHTCEAKPTKRAFSFAIKERTRNRRTKQFENTRMRVSTTISANDLQYSYCWIWQNLRVPFIDCLIVTYHCRKLPSPIELKD